MSCWLQVRQNTISNPFQSLTLQVQMHDTNGVCTDNGFIKLPVGETASSKTHVHLRFSINSVVNQKRGLVFILRKYQ